MTKRQETKRDRETMPAALPTPGDRVRITGPMPEDPDPTPLMTSATMNARTGNRIGA